MPQASPKMRVSRNAWVVLLIVLFCALITIAVLISLVIRSPHEAAVHNSQKLPTVTAKIEQHSLTKPSETLEGQISTGSNQDIKISGDGNPAVVTHVAVNPGDTVRSGSLLGRVSGRPVILLQMPFTLYRDIRVGDSGDDVRALQQSLAALGLYRGVADGKYEALTARSVEALYQRVGAITPPKISIPADSEQAPTQSPQDSEAPHEAGENPAADSDVTADNSPATKPPSPAFIPVLKSELTTMNAATATVEKISSVGTVLSGDQPLATLKIGNPTVRFRAAVSQVPKLTPGTRLEVKDFTDNTKHGVATVVTVGEFNMSSDLGSTAGRDIVATLEGNITTLGDGLKVALKPAGVVETIKGVCVPVTALRQEAGQTYVVLAKERKQVPVKVAETIDGYALLAGKTPPLGSEVIVSVSS